MEWVLYLVSNLNQDHIGQVEEEVIFDGNIDDLHQVQIVEQEDLAEVNRQALEVQVVVQRVSIWSPFH